MTNISKNRSFQLWEYNISHGSLLVRSPKTLDEDFNIDLKFYGVEYVSLPRHLTKVSMQGASDKEIQSLNKLLGRSVSKENVFAIETDIGKFFVVATAFKIEKSRIDIFESPFH